MPDAPRPCCLTIAGSDSGGNAGVQADLRVFRDYGLHGCTAIAAITAQNPFGVSAVSAVPSGMVAGQLDAVLDVFSVRAAKTGMIPDPAAVEESASRLSRHPEIATVVDPVLIATSGARLVPDETADAVMSCLAPIAALVTPNLPEARHLAGADCGGRELAMRIYDRIGRPVLVKGGHAADAESATDVLFDGSDFSEFSAPWVEHPVSTHGTGCSLAAAIAAELALGRGLADAVRGAKEYVREAIARSYPAGVPGCGVLGFAPREIPAGRPVRRAGEI